MTSDEHTLHRRQTQLPRNLRIPNLSRILQRHPPHQFRQVAGTRNRGSASKSLELDIRDGVGGGIDLDLKLHDVPAGGCAHETGAHVLSVLVHLADIAGRGVVV